MKASVERVNAKQIQVHWAAVMRGDYRQPITYYTVKYCPLNMEVQSAYNTINTSNTEIIISGLDPVRKYAVSIAANSEAGRGNFSKEIIAECKYHQMLYKGKFVWEKHILVAFHEDIVSEICYVLHCMMLEYQQYL